LYIVFSSSFFSWLNSNEPWLPIKQFKKKNIQINSNLGISLEIKIIHNMKINPKHTKSHKKHTKRGDWARHGPWHDMATTQPKNPQIDHPEKRKIYPN